MVGSNGWLRHGDHVSDAAQARFMNIMHEALEKDGWFHQGGPQASPLPSPLAGAAAEDAAGDQDVDLVTFAFGRKRRKDVLKAAKLWRKDRKREKRAREAAQAEYAKKYKRRDKTRAAPIHDPPKGSEAQQIALHRTVSIVGAWKQSTHSGRVREALLDDKTGAGHKRTGSTRRKRRQACQTTSADTVKSAQQRLTTSDGKRYQSRVLVAVGIKDPTVFWNVVKKAEFQSAGRAFQVPVVLTSAS